MGGTAGPGPQALLLGRVRDPGRDGRAGGPAGSAGAGGAAVDGLLAAGGAADLMTIAPNRSGRARHCLIPNLLSYPGRIVVVDQDGEAYAATARARARMGHTVVRLDPFGVTGPDTDSLDPIDLVAGLEEPALTTSFQDLADLLPLRTPFGETSEYEAFGLLSGLVGYLSAVPEKLTFDEIYPTMHSDDVVYSLAVVLDTVGAKLPKMSYAEIAAFLGQDERSRNRVLARIRGQVAALGNPEVRAALRHSSFPLAELAAGAPYTVYLVIPAERMPVFAVLLRIWVGTLLHAMLRRRGSDGGGELPLLFLLDHCAELGSFPLLESVLRAGSPDGLRIWSFWHDVHELRATYPVTWPTLVSNSDAVQVFGTTDTAAAAEAEAVLGLAPNEVWSLAPGEQIVRLGTAAHHARKIDQRDAPAAASA